MKVLVTGGAGFIGSHVVDALVEEEHEVCIVDNLSTGRWENINDAARFYNVDIRDKSLLDVFEFEKFDAVIHQAAQVSVVRSLNDIELDATCNILGSINVLECARITGVKKVVYAASAAMYGNPQYLPIDENHPRSPISPYGISKYTVHHYLNFYMDAYDLDFTELVYANVYGPRQDASGEGGVVAIFADTITSGNVPKIYGDGEQTRDFIYVSDVAKANVAALTRGGGETCNVSWGKETSINTIFNTVKAVAGVDIEPEYLPPRPGDIRRSCLCNEKTKEVLTWEPTVELEQGIANILKSYMQPIGL